MQGVTRIDFMPRTALKVALSFNIPDLTEAIVTMSDDEDLTEEAMYAESLLSLNLTGGDTVDAVMEENISHKVTERRELMGVLRTHTLQLLVDLGSMAVKEQLKALQHTDFHIVLSTCGGDRYLAYALPNSSQFGADDQMGQSAQMNVKAVLQSVSGLIRILAQE